MATEQKPISMNAGHATPNNIILRPVTAATTTSGGKLLVNTGMTGGING